MGKSNKQVQDLVTRVRIGDNKMSIEYNNKAGITQDDKEEGDLKQDNQRLDD